MLREIQLLGTTRHEALLPLLGFCLDNRGLCLVYPLMVGGNLEDRLLLTPESLKRLARLGHASPPPPLPWVHRLKIMRQIIGATVYLHTPSGAKGVELHNDIKPSNILLDESLHAKLGDVGLGLPIEGSHEGRTHVSLTGVFGTTGFIDPLLSDTQRCSPVTDGYAIGIALLMCLTGLPALDIKVCASPAHLPRILPRILQRILPRVSHLLTPSLPPAVASRRDAAGSSADLTSPLSGRPPACLTPTRERGRVASHASSRASSPGW